MYLQIQMKGISPLIAAVLLIGVTMLIAGLMAGWAQSIVTTNLETSTTGIDCIGSLDLGSLSFSNGNVSVRIRNLADRFDLEGLSASIEYNTVSKNNNHVNINMSAYNVTDPLGPGKTTWFIYDTADTEKPKSISISADNCKDSGVTSNFR